jgi:hypothetical protein
MDPVKEVVQATNQQIGIRARDVGGIIQREFPESVYTQRDIYNARAIIIREKLDGYNPTTALIYILILRRLTPSVHLLANSKGNHVTGKKPLAAA